MDGVDDARLERAERLLGDAEERLIEAENEAAQTEGVRLERDEARLERDEARRRFDQARLDADGLTRTIEVLRADNAELTERVERAARVHTDMQRSVSWRLTAPLRRIAARGRRDG